MERVERERSGTKRVAGRFGRYGVNDRRNFDRYHLRYNDQHHTRAPVRLANRLSTCRNEAARDSRYTKLLRDQDLMIVVKPFDAVAAGVVSSVYSANV